MQRVPAAEFEPALLARLKALWGNPVNLYRALGNNPKMVAAWTEFAQAIRADSQTPRALRELMILRSGQIQDSEYEWAQHLRMARKAGVREAQIEQLAGWRASAEFDAREKAALELLEAVTACKVTDEVWAIGKAQFSDHELVELVMTASFYCMVGRVLDALQVEMDPDIGEYSPKLPGR